MNDSNGNVLFLTFLGTFFNAHEPLIYGLEMSSSGFLFGAYSFFRALPGSSICLCPLATDWKSFSVTQALIAPDIHFSFDVLGNLTTQITLNCIRGFDGISELCNFIISKGMHPSIRVYPKR